MEAPLTLWRGSASIGVSQRAAPLVGTIPLSYVGPSVAVSDGHMVVAAQWSLPVDGRSPTLGVRRDVVQIALPGWHTTAGEDAPHVASLDGPLLRSRGPSCPKFRAFAGRPAVDRMICLSVGDRPTPFGVEGFFGDLACDISNHRPVAVDLTCVIRMGSERVEIGADVHNAAATARATDIAFEGIACEEVACDVGPKLVHCS